MRKKLYYLDLLTHSCIGIQMNDPSLKGEDGMPEDCEFLDDLYNEMGVDVGDAVDGYWNADTSYLRSDDPEHVAKLRKWFNARGWTETLDDGDIEYPE